MNTLSNFSDFALTRGEMKSVTGGACRVCSTHPTNKQSGTCGTYSLSADDARQYAAQGKASNDGYNYTHDCQ
jgi:hypothetical protein